MFIYTAGEWWNADPEAVISQAMQTGGGPNVSDAYTMNGLPGPLYNCSAKGINYAAFQIKMLLNLAFLKFRNFNLIMFQLDVDSYRYPEGEGEAREDLPSAPNQRSTQ